jgi:hypothetical protein
LFSNTSYQLSSINSGQIEEILILGIVVLSSICCKYFGKCGFGQVFVFGTHQAARFIQVKTTSFTHFFSNSLISSITSCTSLFL